ncbi:MAG: exodeoxyribonuclease VII small subunit [Bacteroidota bacterium]
MSNQYTRQESGQFESAYEELRNLVNEMESGNLSLDELVDRVEKARNLLNFCHERLRSVKEEIRGTINPEQP